MIHDYKTPTSLYNPKRTQFIELLQDYFVQDCFASAVVSCKRHYLYHLKNDIKKTLARNNYVCYNKRRATKTGYMALLNPPKSVLDSFGDIWLNVIIDHLKTNN